MDYINRINEDLTRRENEMNGIVDIMEKPEEEKPERKKSERELFIGVKKSKGKNNKNKKKKN